MTNDFDVTAAVRALWAKSDAGGKPQPLVAHLFDAAAVAEIIWDQYASLSYRRKLDSACKGKGREVFVLLAALHDLGKATPAFQIKSEALAVKVRAAGLKVPAGRSQDWPHWKAGAFLMLEELREVGRPSRWVAAVLEAHHGWFDARATYRDGTWDRLHGDGRWEAVQRELLATILTELEYSLESFPRVDPSHGLQLATAGYICMADWIASGPHFPGLGEAPSSLALARGRAETAWQSLGFRRGWEQVGEVTAAKSFEERFGFQPRPLQGLASVVGAEMGDGGLVIVEAPMGEGKSEFGMYVAELIAHRTGADGLAFAMPTQGTTDAMFGRVVDWAAKVDPSTPVGLIHGKAMANKEWAEKISPSVSEVFDFEVDDPYGTEPSGASPGQAAKVGVPDEWLRGKHRTLLTPIVVGTIDQLLYAAAQVKFVSMRWAGLIGKIVVIDEVHSYDVYMSKFLETFLRWCASAKIPVILMSATLADSLRAKLQSAYCGWDDEFSKPVQGQTVYDESYPRVSLVKAAGAQQTVSCSPTNPDRGVEVEVMPTHSVHDLDDVANSVVDQVSQGGCGLVILNVVARAQGVYQRLKEAGVPVLLIHGKLTTAERADRTAKALDLLGKVRTRESGRPDRFVVVATQIAEQSFDIDADFLVSDLAPVDLLVQRIGRVHRHDRPVEDRPAQHRHPSCLVAGLIDRGERPPTLLKYPYELLPTLRAAAVVLDPETEWAMPSHIPALVARGYEGPLEEWCPAGWQEVAREFEAELLASEQERENHAKQHCLLVKPEATDVAGLHEEKLEAAEHEQVLVRDGEPTLEVTLVARTPQGFATLAGRPLGVDCERCLDNPALSREVLGDSVRMKPDDRVVTELAWTPGSWAASALLKRQKVLVVADRGQLQSMAGDQAEGVFYSPELGLVVGGNYATHN